jgi:prolyl oligopeptidase
MTASDAPLASTKNESVLLEGEDDAAAATAIADALAERKAEKEEDEEDPYLWLEDIESERSLDFVRASNAACLEALGNPKTKESYRRILKVLGSYHRIPHASQFGFLDEDKKVPVLYNFVKDVANPKGLWQKTTLDSYTSDSKTKWTTVLDVDELAKKDGISWVWKGCTPLPRSRDPAKSSLRVTRALLSLSRGGSDASHMKEFDLEEMEFVTDKPFELPEAKSQVSYKSRDVVLVGTDFGPGSLTDSGYPRTVREWVRGTSLDDAPVVFEGDAKDVSVDMYVRDQRTWGGGVYEVQRRFMTFYTGKYWIRKVQFEHLLAPDDPARANVPDPPDFREVDVQDDATLDLLGNLALISLRSDWQPRGEGGPLYKKGSVVYCHADTFFEHGMEATEFLVLFEPTDQTAYEYYKATKNYLILATIDNVKSRLDFYRISGDGSALTLVEAGRTKEAQIRDCRVRPVDPFSGSDDFWFTTSDFVTPSTLFLGNAGKVEKEYGDESEEAGVAGRDRLDPFIQSKVKSLPPQYDSSGLITEQRTAISKDGTAIPYFIVMKEKIVLNGNNPTLLCGYGGFEVYVGPHYIAKSGIAWLERGGVYVEANIRGGGEFGPAWHQAALKANRNKCYEDFIAVAEHLIASNLCAPKTLAIWGRSNGGLLMGNMYTMRPDLFGAIHCAAPLL